MLEEHTYFAVIYMLWQRDDVWSEYGPHVFEDVPFLMRGVVSSMVRSGILRDLHGQVRPAARLLSYLVQPHRGSRSVPLTPSLHMMRCGMAELLHCACENGARC